jgi:glycerol-3-phosphate acyltransferase PlsX
MAPPPVVRTMKDWSLCGPPRRSGRQASAMVSAGNTGATMASALLRMGRIKGVARPAIATPIPVPGSTPTVRSTPGPTPSARRLAGAVRPDGRRVRPRALRHRRARVGLLSIGEESSKGNPGRHPRPLAEPSVLAAGRRCGQRRGPHIMTETSTWS